MITAQEKERRKKFLGSSDAAAILGLDEFRTPYDVWADKCGLIAATGGEHQSDAIDVGTWCEEGVLRWFAAKRGIKLILSDPADPDRTRRVHANGIMAANFDALVEGNPAEACEAKTHGVISRYVSDEWGEEGTDAVPQRVALQCQHQMAVLPELRLIHVPVLLGGVGLRAYYVERNETLIRDLTAYSEYFWNEFVAKQTPPLDAVPSIETARKLKRVPNKTVSLADELVAAWLSAKENLKAAEEEKKKKELLLLTALGDAECGVSTMGTLSYYLRERKEYFAKATTYRQLVFSQPKGK